MSGTTPFAEIEADIARETHEAFGVDATYTHGASDPVLCRVVIDRNVEIFGDMGQVVERRTAVSFLSAEVAMPVRGAVVAASSGAWKVDKVVEDDGCVVKVLVVK